MDLVLGLEKMIINGLNKMMDEYEIWEQVVRFAKEERWDGEFTHATDLVNDLKLKGDDAYEFICSFSDRFNVNIADFKFEEYFYPEGDCVLRELLNIVLFRKIENKKKITLGNLVEGVKEGRLI